MHFIHRRLNLFRFPAKYFELVVFTRSTLELEANIHDVTFETNNFQFIGQPIRIQFRFKLDGNAKRFYLHIQIL